MQALSYTKALFSQVFVCEPSASASCLQTSGMGWCIPQWGESVPSGFSTQLKPGNDPAKAGGRRIQLHCCGGQSGVQYLFREDFWPWKGQNFPPPQRNFVKLGHQRFRGSQQGRGFVGCRGLNGAMLPGLFSKPSPIPPERVMAPCGWEVQRAVGTNTPGTSGPTRARMPTFRPSPLCP